MNREKEKRAVQYLKNFEPESEPYYLCYSGGKDSDAIRILAELSGVKFDLEHNHTTVDAPETVHYIRSIPGVHISYPEMSMWDLIVKSKMPPTRFVRYCCKYLKERGGIGRMKVTGVRWAESVGRKESAGFVRIIGKQKTIQKKADESDLEYKISRQGGLLPDDINNGKPNCRLDRRRRMGFFKILWMSVKSPLSVRREKGRLYRMPYARPQRDEK